MAQLTDVPEIDQQKMMAVFRYAIKSGSNALILGPSGGGKTHMAFQVIEELDCIPIYINMSVLERTDFQGMPVISVDKNSVHYAIPDFLPFNDVKAMKSRQAVELLEKWVSRSGDKFGNKEESLALIGKEIEKLQELEELHALKKVMNHIPNKNLDKFKKQIDKLDCNLTEGKPLVFIFDEVDKAISEVLQTLLEFLQFHSINGRKMNIKACILTGNLPDEHAHTNQISHAITKRCMTFKLVLDFNQWRMWAIDLGNISPLITGFLTQHPTYLHRGPPDGDETAYALPSPRTWEEASKALRALSENNFGFTNGEARDNFRLILMSGCIGTTAAIQFSNWHKHYHELDPVINNLLENGVYPEFMPGEDKRRLGTEDFFICALSACAKIEQSLKPDNEEIYTKYIKNTFNWFGTLPVDIQIGSIRMIFGNNFDESKGQVGLVKRFKLAEIPEFTKVFVDVTKNQAEWTKFATGGGLDKFNEEAEKMKATTEEVDSNASGS
jgi:MoxR-like ATPase